MFTAFRVKNVFAFSIVFMLAFPVNAADIVLSDACSLADALKATNIDEATGGCPAGDGADTITLTADITLNAVLPHVMSEIKIEGEGYTISGNNRFRIFAVNGGNLTVNNLTMTKGNADWGGAVVNVKGSLVINESTIINSSASEGGAIGNEGKLSISDSDIRNNASDLGGAIHSLSGNLFVTNSTLKGNSSEDRGGAIFTKTGSLTVDSTTISFNIAEEAGGGVWAGAQTNMQIKGESVVEKNISKWDHGGGIWLGDEVQLSIQRGSSIRLNSSYYNGAGVYIHDGTVEIALSKISHNSSGHFGGGIYCNFGTLNLTEVLINGNSAENGGGGIDGYACRYTISNSTIVNNTVKRGGSFSRGGGLDINRPTTISNSAFINNSAELGGGIHIELGSKRHSVKILNSTFFANIAHEDGGAVYIGDNFGNTELGHVTIYNNSAERGGGLHRSAGSEVSLLHSLIASNRGGDCFGRLVENVGNFIADGSCFATLTGDPMLGDLVEPEDGLPAYVPLLEGSPAIDAAADEYCPDTDIIGTPRPQGAACDIGAFEYTGPTSD